MILAALERQSFHDFEVIIADDGSRKDVVAMINDIMTASPLHIQHVWHDDIGFRKTKILNDAIRNSRSGYLVFIDGDCIPHSGFMRAHFQNREEHTLLAGRRTNLSEKLSRKLSADKIRSGYLDKGFLLPLILDGLFGKSTHVMKGLYVGNPWLSKILNRTVRGVLGCNFSVHKNDLVEINGFDERYQAPAVGEDTDVEVRLIWNKVRIKMLKNLAVQYHIYHPKLSRPDVNLDLFKTVLAEKQSYTPYGMVRRDIENR
jgi:glycosyltransferase involved in cell wall biosynthesis